MRFADYGKRVVFAAFDGGEITSDAGVLLLREQARRIHLFERMAGCFTDHRDRERLPDQTDNCLGGSFLHWCYAPSGHTLIDSAAPRSWNAACCSRKDRFALGTSACAKNTSAAADRWSA